MKKIRIAVINLVLCSCIYAECYELNYSDCLYWSSYCEWNDETGQCQDIGGGGGGGEADGPYEYATITDSILDSIFINFSDLSKLPSLTKIYSLFSLLLFLLKFFISLKHSINLFSSL